MTRRITSKNYLRIGINTCVFIALFACGKSDIEYIMKMEIVFKNDTDSTIGFLFRPHASASYLEFVKIYPKSESKTFDYTIEGADKLIDPTTCCKNFVGNLFELAPPAATIYINDGLCVIHYQQYVVDVSNYEIEEIGYRKYRYTFVFTKQKLENASPCN
jgi:hypothetical protein